MTGPIPGLLVRVRDERRGHHVHTRVFVGHDADHLALSGTLVMDIGQWQAFGCALLIGADRLGPHHLRVECPDSLAVVEPGEACDHPRCSGGIHWTGRTEPDTGADGEEGACPSGDTTDVCRRCEMPTDADDLADLDGVPHCTPCIEAEVGARGPEHERDV